MVSEVAAATAAAVAAPACRRCRSSSSSSSNYGLPNDPPAIDRALGWLIPKVDLHARTEKVRCCLVEQQKGKEEKKPPRERKGRGKDNRIEKREKKNTTQMTRKRECFALTIAVPWMGEQFVGRKGNSQRKNEEKEMEKQRSPPPQQDQIMENLEADGR